MLKCVLFLNPKQIYEYDTKSFSLIQNIDDLIKAIKRNNIETLFFNDGNWIEYFEIFRKKLPKLKLIMRSGGNEIMKASYYDMNVPIFERQKIWAKLINNNIDYILANSAFSKRRMQEIGVLKSKIIVVRGGVDLKKCNYNVLNKEYEKKKIKREYGIKNRYIFTIVSRFEKFKGIDKTILELSKCQEIDWHLIIVGDGSERNRIEYLLSKEIAPSKYTLINKVANDEALRIISISDILLNCSINEERKSGRDTYTHTETMGRSMMEAVCQRVRIIATDVGGTSEIFEENPDAGYLIKEDQPLNKVIKRLGNYEKENTVSCEIYKYGWEYIFTNLYLPLMNLKHINRFDSALIVDIE